MLGPHCVTIAIRVIAFAMALADNRFKLVLRAARALGPAYLRQCEAATLFAELIAVTI